MTFIKFIARRLLRRKAQMQCIVVASTYFYTDPAWDGLGNECEEFAILAVEIVSRRCMLHVVWTRCAIRHDC